MNLFNKTFKKMSLQEIYDSQNLPNDKKEDKSLIVRVPELTSLIKHLDLLYYRLIKKEELEKKSEGLPIVDILGKPHVQTRSWFNPGQGIKQSAVVQ
jgi:hypothetical protein